MKELSIFIDESGDFGKYNFKSPYYIIGMVFHDQRNDVSEAIGRFDDGLKEIGFKYRFVHVGPLIRREAGYYYNTVEDRVRILRRLMNFVAHVDLSYKCFVVEKKYIDEREKLIAKLAKQVSDFIKQNYPFFLFYDRVKIYYDNGQTEVTKIIISVFTSLLGNVKLKKALQKDYKLLQVADLACTVKLTEIKMKQKTLSRSERRILGNDRDIKKFLLKPLKKKEFRG